MRSFLAEANSGTLYNEAAKRYESGDLTLKDQELPDRLQSTKKELSQLRAALAVSRRESSNLIFETINNNNRHEDKQKYIFIDLHGQVSQDAVRIAKDCIDRTTNALRNGTIKSNLGKKGRIDGVNNHIMKFITGVGKHCAKGTQAVLKEKVLDCVTKELELEAHVNHFKGYVLVRI